MRWSSTLPSFTRSSWYARARRSAARLSARSSRVSSSATRRWLTDWSTGSSRSGATVLGHNPGPFTGPGTNTYIVGVGRRPMLLDTGAGVPIYEELLPHALKEVSSTDEFERVVCTHAHADHIGGIPQVHRRFGELE